MGKLPATDHWAASLSDAKNKKGAFKGAFLTITQCFDLWLAQFAAVPHGQAC